MYDKIFVSDTEVLVDIVMDFVGLDDTTYFIAKYEKATDIIKFLIRDYGGIPRFLDLQYPDWDGYEKEYLVSVSNNVIGYNISCEPLFNMERNEYLKLENEEAENFFILEDCNQKVVKTLNPDKVHVVIFGKEDKTEDNKQDECVGCHDSIPDYTSESTYIHKENNIPVGFSKDWSSEINGVTCSTSYSFFCDDLEMLRNNAFEWNVEL